VTRSQGSQRPKPRLSARGGRRSARRAPGRAAAARPGTRRGAGASGRHPGRSGSPRCRLQSPRRLLRRRRAGGTAGGRLRGRPPDQVRLAWERDPSGLSDDEEREPCVGQDGCKVKEVRGHRRGRGSSVRRRAFRPARRPRRAGRACARGRPSTTCDSRSARVAVSSSFHGAEFAEATRSSEPGHLARAPPGRRGPKRPR
jgi:hypothetical protein